MIRALRPLLRSSTRIIPSGPIYRRAYSVAASADAFPAEQSGAPQPPKTIRFAETSKSTAQSNDSSFLLGDYSLTLEMPTRGVRRFDYVWLREGCRCPRCVDPNTKQRNFNLASIPEGIAPETVQWNGKQLEILWKNDIRGYEDHKTTYNVDFLSSPAHRHLTIHKPTMRPYHWSKNSMKFLQHWVSYEDYMNDSVKFATAMRHLAGTGLIFVKDIPQSRESVEKIATRMGPLRNSFYGQTWDVRSVQDPKNVAYTDKPLEFHMDLLYMDEVPGYQLLHCLENSCEGGESLFADSFKAVSHLRQHFPHKFQRLLKTNLKYEYDNDNAIYSNIRPVIELNDRTREVTHVNYSPPFQAHTNPSSFGRDDDTRQKMMKALAYFKRALEHEPNVFELKLDPGQCVIFENRRVVHSRRQFNSSSGHRWLAGAYVDADALRSRFRKCQRDHPNIWKDAFRTEVAEYQKRKKDAIECQVDPEGEWIRE